MRHRTQQNNFALQVKTRLLRRHQTVTAFALELGLNRNSASLAIHQRRELPRITAAIKAALSM